MVHAILLAGGSGSRMQNETPKQLMEIAGRKVICWSLDVFEKSHLIDDVILVTRKEDIPYFRSEIVDRYGYKKVRRICPGGERRVDSVENGLKAINDDEDEERIVLIHDSARPFVTDKMVEDSISCIRDGFNACTVGVPVKDTIKQVTTSSGNVIGTSTPERSKLYIIQTPQTFS
jgi:2-C-methyl-D-erythritol 4-phosphate cytidylyltransferase